MKHFKFLLLVVACLAAYTCSEYDDSELWQEIENLKSRVGALENAQKTANSNIEALQKLVEGVQGNLSIVGVPEGFNDESGSGWIIKFSDGSSIKIYNGKDGSDAPVIGVQAVGGVYYWTITVDGKTEFLLDSSGNRIPTTGAKGEDGKDAVAPKLEIRDDGYWYVSTDNGASWTKLIKASDDSAIYFTSVKVVGDKVIVVTSDGQTLILPLSTLDLSTVFDESSIVLSVAAISDTHIGNQYGSEAKFTSALNQLKAKAAEHDADGIDAVMVVGDLVNTANTGQITTYKTLYEQVFDPVKVPMIYTIGNHDMNPNYSWSASTVTQNAVFHSILGDNYFLTDQDQTMRKNFECRHCIVGDYHILAITPNGSSPVIYDANSTSWLDKQLKEITAADPFRYVIVLTHPMIYDTVYGSDLGTYWYTTSLTDILKNYPQVVTFSGHLHFPINDPRSIWQGDFTSVGCGSTSYMAFEGGDYENKSSSTVLSDAGEVSSGHLVQFDVNGNMRITRMDFTRQAEIGTAWETAYPTTGKAHLAKYNHAVLKAANTAPVLSTADVTVGTISSGKADVSVKFAAGTDDEFVHHYSVAVKQGVVNVAAKNYMADFYRNPRPSQMKGEWECTFSSLPEGAYTLSIVAYDSWGAASAPLTKDFTVGAASGSASIWTTDAAGSEAHAGGSGTVSSDWLSYADGTVSWTANESGKPRSASIELPNGDKYEVTQLEVKDYAGKWSFEGKTFAPNANLGVAAAASTVRELTFAVKEGQTARYSGTSITNNLTVSGLINTYVAEAAVVIDYDRKLLSLGFFFDGENAQAVNTGKAGYGYVTLLPELGNGWDKYNFCPVPFNNGSNKGWLWFVNDSLTSMHYGRADWQKCDGNDILGLSFCACKAAKPTAGDYATVNTNSGYDVIWQCNNNTQDNPGFILTKK